MQDDRIYIKLINGPFRETFLFREKGTPAEYKAGLDLAIERGWLVLHESGTYVKFGQSGADVAEIKKSLERGGARLRKIGARGADVHIARRAFSVELRTARPMFSVELRSALQRDSS